MRLWRQGKTWRLKAGRSTYYGPLKGALGYGWRAWREDSYLGMWVCIIGAAVVGGLLAGFLGWAAAS